MRIFGTFGSATQTLYQAEDFVALKGFYQISEIEPKEKEKSSAKKQLYEFQPKENMIFFG